MRRNSSYGQYDYIIEELKNAPLAYIDRGATGWDLPKFFMPYYDDIDAKAKAFAAQFGGRKANHLSKALIDISKELDVFDDKFMSLGISSKLIGDRYELGYKHPRFGFLYDKRDRYGRNPKENPQYLITLDEGKGDGEMYYLVEGESAAEAKKTFLAERELFRPLGRNATIKATLYKSNPSRRKKGANMPIIFENPGRRRRNAMQRRKNTELPAGSEMYLITIEDVKIELRKMGADPSQFTIDQYRKAIEAAKRYVNRAAYDGYLFNGHKVAAQMLLENEVKPSALLIRNPMLEMDFEEEIDDLPALRNPRRKVRRNKFSDKKRKDLIVGYRGDDDDANWWKDEEAYLDYLVARKIARGSKRSPQEIKATERAKLRARRK